MSKELDINIVTKEVIVELATNSAKNIYGRIKDYFKDTKMKEEIDFRYAYENYLEASLKSYSKVKTLIYRQEPKDLYAFYECVGVRHGNNKINTKSIHNIINIGHKLIITGTGGIGKTTMLKHFFINTIKETNLVPVLVELRKLNDKDLREIDIIDIIYESLTNFGFNLEKKYFEYSMEVGCYLILFDGYDEVKQESTQKISKEIHELSSKYCENYYILSSRPTEEFIGWHDFVEMPALSLNKEQALSLIKKIDYDAKVKEKFYNELKLTLYDKYKSFASNPLLLTIMLLTFEDRASIPDKLNDFYEQAFATLYNKHDASKGTFRRPIASNLGYEDFKKVFSYFCFKSYFERNFEFSEADLIRYINLAKEKLDIGNKFKSEDFKKDLINSVCMLYNEGLSYRFSHRSFQEYFAALYTTTLSDEIQKKLISSWLQEMVFASDENYLYMLFDLQKDRFNKNVIYPALLTLRKKFEDNCESYNCIYTEIYKSILLKEENEDNEVNILGFGVNNSYALTIIRFVCNVRGYKSNKDKSNYKNKSEVLKLLRSKLGEKELFELEDIEKAGIMKEFIEYFPSLKRRFDFCMEFLKEIEDNNTVKSKRKFESILDQL